jgi:hypothetical protein
MKRVTILISAFIPVSYLITYLLLSKVGLPVEVRVFIAEYGSALVIFQFFISVIGCFIFKKIGIRVFLLLFFLSFAVFLFNTVERFNPV